MRHERGGVFHLFFLDDFDLPRGVLRRLTRRVRRVLCRLLLRRIFRVTQSLFRPRLCVLRGLYFLHRRVFLRCCVHHLGLRVDHHGFGDLFVQTFLFVEFRRLLHDLVERRGLVHASEIVPLLFGEIQHAVQPLIEKCLLLHFHLKQSLLEFQFLFCLYFVQIRVRIHDFLFRHSLLCLNRRERVLLFLFKIRLEFLSERHEFEFALCLLLSDLGVRRPELFLQAFLLLSQCVLCRLRVLHLRHSHLFDVRNLTRHVRFRRGDGGQRGGVPRVHVCHHLVLTRGCVLYARRHLVLTSGCVLHARRHLVLTPREVLHFLARGVEVTLDLVSFRRVPRVGQFVFQPRNLRVRVRDFFRVRVHWNVRVRVHWNVRVRVHWNFRVRVRVRVRVHHFFRVDHVVRGHWNDVVRGVLRRSSSFPRGGRRAELNGLGDFESRETVLNRLEHVGLFRIARDHRLHLLRDPL